MFQQVRQLLDLITKSVNTLEQVCLENNAQLPSLDEPFHPASEAFRANPVAAEAVIVISAAAMQLDAIVSPPRAVLHHVVGGHWKSAAARVCLEGSVTEILREAGPKGLHVNDIGAKNGLDAQKLASCLRVLATHHIYREVRPDVFANNRVSSLLDTWKPSAEIIINPYQKHEDTNGVAAIGSHLLDENFKASAYLWETVSDPKTAKSGEPNEAPFSRAIGNGKTFWQWLEQPKNAFIQHRFDIAMSGIQALTSNAVILSAYDWNTLPQNALVVDVGGGIGSASLVLAKEFPNLRIAIQDRHSAVENGVEIWNEKLFYALSSGRVQFQVHDFFAPQPPMDASIFFLKNVLHDWSDKYGSKILKRLRDAATPRTKLICLELIIPYACHDTEEDDSDGITGSANAKAQKPLLANWGAVNDSIYHADIALMSLCNGGERSIGQFDQLFKGAGWKITAVRRQPGVDLTLFASIVAVPI
ncbi:S-adenosyl-L-methionine-dependent methyltransferase [Amanita rubescens]|nr:S-adenosyl-L-methionine-dependent methyltransferase [Amanita rubescens]